MDWDLTPYFPSFDGPEYRAFRDALEADVASLGGELAALGDVSAQRAGWVTALRRLEDLAERSAHLGSYVSCLASADSRNEGVQRESARLAQLRAELSKRYARVRAALREAEDAEFEALLAEPDLAHAGYFLRRQREDAAHRMATELEELAADLEVTGLAAWSRLYGRLSGQLEFELAVPGEPTRRVPVAQARSLQGDARAEVRRAALRGANEAWAAHGVVFAACLNAISGTRLSLYRRRGIDDFLEPALFDAGITRATLDAMLDAVRARRELPRRYLRAKAAALDVARLGFQDLEAPLPLAAGERVSFDEGRGRVLAAFAARYPALEALALRAFEGRWIDWSARAGKRPGGFCSTSAWLGQSRVFLNYGGTAGDVSTLAHELGHAFHGWLLRDARSFARRYPMTLAETASTFAEQLLNDAALEAPGADRETRLDVLDRRLRDGAAFLLNLPMRFEFERRVYEERAGGELSAARLCELMNEAQREWYGAALDELDPWFWASKLHFYIAGTTFYNFPYTFGYLFSLGLFSRAKQEGQAFLPRYEEVLRLAGRDSAPAIARRCLGVELERPDFWHASIDAVEADLARFERELTGSD